MSNITMTIVRLRGEALPLGRNVAVRLLLDKSNQDSDRRRIANPARESWIKSFRGRERFEAFWKKAA